MRNSICLILTHANTKRNPMPFIFESRATGPMLMMQAPAKALLDTLGRSLADGNPPDEGVFTIEQLPEVVEKLEALIERSKQQASQTNDAAGASGKDPQEQQGETIGMHQRAWPLLDQCRRSLTAEKPVTWRKT
ncbi:MAG: DUF1840 domain-containing protein [Betaproteobacteria bacterium]|jgi:hypothetical protein|nr:DUF1840 family protein [Pseudomonadota bacterium]NBO94459.1 DUF1840 domain-containing protein [Betaproteobacteria bacterium]NBP35372.1 DUF1840 domain-containing protein [Betaproteobacteria bacterium]NBP37997.1 DUF1840 domain-containing protein [Betaproteobacteria bacterium]NBQ78390.1 DUF1840 domain-containing protein [Betaproteobacteria bacterium]